jgi:hypothetical protein
LASQPLPDEATAPDAGEPRWWQTNWAIAAAALVATLPLIGPSIPPLIDMPGHIGRYRIMAEANSGPLAAHYAVHRALIGNLGIDLAVLALRPLLDVETAAHLVVALIPALLVASMLWLSREAHGRISPAAGFALPLAYALPFQFGFVNFVASAGLSFIGLALWLRLAKRRATWVRVAVLMPFAGLVWICHSFGWAMLGLFIVGAEWTIQRARGRPTWQAALIAAALCAPMAWPQILAILFGTTAGGDTGDWFDLISKAQWVASMLRERWKVYDVLCVIILALLLWTVVRSKRLSFVPVLGVPALLGSVVFVLLPRLYQGGAYVDMRLLPYVVALGVLAIRVRGTDERLERRLATWSFGFFAMRTVTSIIALALFARDMQAELPPLSLIPVGSSVLALVDEPSSASWDNRRLTHIAGLAVARRRAFTNEQWSIPGQQLIRPLHPGAMPFDRDPSQLIEPKNPKKATIDFDLAIREFSRADFRYVWTIGFPIGRAHAADLEPIWSSDRSALYRVRTPSGPSVE